jgi:hypothetical protein
MHPQARRKELRGLYVFKQLPMEAACAAMSLARSTANRWKLEAKAEGDDWDNARAAVAMGDDSFKQVGQQLLTQYLTMHQSVLNEISLNGTASAEKKAQMLAGLADSFNKTVAAFRRITPEVNSHAIALDVLSRLISHVQGKHPQAAPALLEVLDSFGVEIAKAYG